MYKNEADSKAIDSLVRKVIEQLKAEFGDLNSPENDSPELTDEKGRRILELFSADLKSDDLEKLAVAETALWHVRTSILAPFDALLQTPWDIAVHGTGPTLRNLGTMGSYWQETEVRFESDEQLKRHIDRLLEPLGMRIDAEHASISAILRDGSQLEAILPPLSSDGPMVTIKRPRPPVCRKLCELSGPPSVPLLSQNVVDMLTACVRGKVNIIVSGACDSNKAEVLNALCQELTFQAFKFAHPRIIAIEREQILSLPKGHIIRLKSSGHNQFVLLKKALAMMPDRVVLDECTGDEVYDLLNLMASPLKGAMTTINANSARDCLYRLENMVLLSHAALPQQNVRYLIAEAHPLIIHVRRFEDGVHRIAEIVELQGINDDQWHSRTLIDQLKDDVPRDNDYIIAPLFQIECRGRDRRGFFKCRLKSTSNTPLFVEQLSNEAIPFEHNWLKSEDDVARAID